jgi:hypothetical protein
MKNGNITKAIKALVLAAVPAIAFFAGTFTSQAGFEPQTATDVNADLSLSARCQLVSTHTVQSIETPVTVVEYVDRVQEIPVEPRNFRDLQELEQWLTETITMTTTIYFEQPGARVDCDDFALTLQQKALADGYLVSFQIIESGKYDGLFEYSKTPPDTLHAINLAIAGNNAYYIEPQTGEVVFAARVD